MKSRSAGYLHVRLQMMPDRKSRLKRLFGAFFFAVIALFIGGMVLGFPWYPKTATQWRITVGALLLIPLVLITIDTIGKKSYPLLGSSDAERREAPHLGRALCGSMSACGAFLTVAFLGYSDFHFLPPTLNEVFLAAAIVSGPLALLTAVIALILSVGLMIRGAAVHRRRVSIWWGGLLFVFLLDPSMHADTDTSRTAWLVVELIVCAMLAIMPGVWLVRESRGER